ENRTHPGMQIPERLAVRIPAFVGAGQELAIEALGVGAALLRLAPDSFQEVPLILGDGAAGKARPDRLQIAEPDQLFGVLRGRGPWRVGVREGRDRCCEQESAHNPCASDVFERSIQAASSPFRLRPLYSLIVSL